MLDGGINPIYVEFTIANGQTTSGLVDLSGVQIVGIFTPSAMTGSVLYFSTPTYGGTFVDVYDRTNTRYSVTIATSAARFYILEPASFCGLKYLKVISGSSEGSARTLYGLCRPV